MKGLKTFRFSSLGWGFLTAWGIEGMLMSDLPDTGAFIFSGVVASLSNIFGFALIVLVVWLARTRQRARQRTRQRTRQKDSPRLPSTKLAVLAALLMSINSLLYLIDQVFDVRLQVLKYCALVVASFGYVLLTVLWGRHYASRDIGEIETYAIWSTFLCALMYLLALVTLPLVSMVVWCCLPLATCLCLLHCQREAAAAEKPRQPYQSGSAPKEVALRTYWRFGLSVFAASLVVSLPTGLSRLTALQEGALGLTTLSGLLVAVVLIVYCTIFARRLNLSTFYRVLSPLTVGGLFLITLPYHASAFAGFGLLFAAQWALYLFVWIYLAELCHKITTNPILVFVAGRLLFEAGFLVAYILGSLLPAFVIDLHIPLVFVLFAIVVLFVLTTLLPIDSDTGSPHVAPQGASASSDHDRMLEVVIRQTNYLTNRYGLSPRESEIVQYLVRGYSLPSIRNELFIAKSTIDSHVQKVYKKCNIHSRQELIALFNQAETP